ncbi:hypothetical protein [Kineococcus sp. R86509]|uniref:hypothetical protein n=1 Tax=Kineococcus sp. R86509 TaxID=3093851 RepID=UPI0036D4007B
MDGDGTTPDSAVGVMSPVVVVVRDTVRDLTAVLWAARYAEATTGRLHVLLLEPAGEPPTPGIGPGRVDMTGLQASVERSHPSVRLTWDLTWRSPARGEVGMPGSGGLLVSSRWSDGLPFQAPSAGCTVVVVPEHLCGGAAGVVAVLDPDNDDDADADGDHVVAAAREFARVRETTLLVVAPSEATRASRHAELLVIGEGRLDLPGIAFSALSWPTRRAVAVVPSEVRVRGPHPPQRATARAVTPFVPAPIGP